MTASILMIHALAGFLALGMVGVALATKKGALWHRRAGQIYVMCMFAVSLTTLWLVSVRPNPFLLAVGIFSFFLVFTGWRAARIRDGKPRMIDHGMGAMMCVTGVVMLGWGLMQWIAGDAAFHALVLFVFGAIGLSLAISDWRDWRRGEITGKPRIARHLSRMLAGTIATLTAAMVVNLTFLPNLLVWLGPTVVLTPVIFWWSSRVLRKV